LQENAAYVAAFRKFYGKDIFANTEKAYHAMTGAIAAFEKTGLFSPFDSRYDRSLRGEYKLTGQEELGRLLFFSHHSRGGRQILAEIQCRGV
jgi:cytochrome c peroxidase